MRCMPSRQLTDAAAVDSDLASGPSAPNASRASNPTTGQNQDLSPRRSPRTSKSAASAPLPDDTGNPVVECEKEPKLPPKVQCGLYAAEMLCGSLGATHCINLFIVGTMMQLCSSWQTFILLQMMWCGCDTMIDRGAFSRRASISSRIWRAFSCCSMPCSV